MSAVLLLAVLTLTSAASACVLQAQDVRPGDLLLTGGTLWDGTGDAARPNPGVLVRNGTIMAIGVRATDSVAGTRVLRLPDDAFVMPGLFDLHAHYAVDLFGEGRIDEYTVNPVLFLANGVTSTFPAGEVDPDEARRGRERIARGEIPGPRIYPDRGRTSGAGAPGGARRR